MAEIQSQRNIVEKKIRKACANDFLSLGELSEILKMNKHTLRAHYLYPMVKGGQLVREPLPPAKNKVKYMSVRVNN